MHTAGATHPGRGCIPSSRGTPAHARRNADNAPAANHANATRHSLQKFPSVPSRPRSHGSASAHLPAARTTSPGGAAAMPIRPPLRPVPPPHTLCLDTGATSTPGAPREPALEARSREAACTSCGWHHVCTAPDVDNPRRSCSHHAPRPRQNHRSDRSCASEVCPAVLRAAYCSPTCPRVGCLRDLRSTSVGATDPSSTLLCLLSSPGVHSIRRRNGSAWY